MSKRADWKSIKNLIVNEKFKKQLTSIPLVDLSNMTFDKIPELPTDDEGNTIIELDNIDQSLFPVRHFNFVPDFTNEPNLITDDVKSIYQIHLYDNAFSIECIANVKNPRDSRLTISNFCLLLRGFDENNEPQEDIFAQSLINKRGEVLYKDIIDEDHLSKFSKEGNDKYNYWKGHLYRQVIKLVSKLHDIQQGDFYPIVKQKKSKHGKLHQPKSWKRDDLSTIVYLNALPEEKEKSAPKGGHHSSPRRHQRRGHERKLTHEKYKNHPKYGQKIWVKPAWVGKTETVCNGVTYKVLLKDEDDE